MPVQVSPHGEIMTALVGAHEIGALRIQLRLLARPFPIGRVGQFYVSLQVLFLRETFVAQMAHVWFQFQVDVILVPFQVGLVLETLAALGTT